MSAHFGNLCIECWEDTSFGSGRFVNRIPADNGMRDGYMCEECQSITCDQCGESTLEYDENWMCPDCSEAQQTSLLTSVSGNTQTTYKEIQ